MQSGQTSAGHIRRFSCPGKIEFMATHRCVNINLTQHCLILSLGAMADSLQYFK